ncbi:MAG TPA: ABC transporter ATP-binding protein, partial [Rectinema sp.]|nr:ABC transporter ATP-binding protein [Rectinema sp.]
MERMASLVSIEDLRVAFSLGKKETTVLRGINLSILGNEIHGLVGESGSGKTVTSTCIIGLLPIPPARILSGHIYFDGKDLLSLPEDQMRTYRGRKIAMIFQEPAKYLNPAFKIGEQIIEMLMLHMGMKKRSAYERVVELLRLVGLDEKVIDSYPHELSGGMKQRAMIAMAISCDPDLIIADEPTTALDVTLQVQILALLKKLKDMRKQGVL